MITKHLNYIRPHRWFYGAGWRRYAALIGADSISITLAVVFALLWVPWSSNPLTVELVGIFIFVGLISKLSVFYAEGLYFISLRYVSARDLIRVGRAVIAGELLFVIFVAAAAQFGIVPHSYTIIPMDFLITLFLISGSRTIKRAVLELSHESNRVRGKKILIVGAGDAGEQIVRAIHSDNSHTYRPLGFIDDDPSKIGMLIHGVKVLGTRDDIERITRKLDVTTILIALPSVDGEVVNEIVTLVRKSGITDILILPPLVELLSGTVNLTDLQDLRPEDLLRRQKVVIEMEEVSRLIKGSVVLVTGAGGSIGSELCKQISGFTPRKLILYERDETALFDVDRQLRARFPGLEILTVLGDIRHRAKVGSVIASLQPSLVFHTAAYKHVPLMEENPVDALSNNVIGTKTVAEACVKYRVEKFVLISTDKAVKPSSVMGATKRLAEELVREFNDQGETRFIAVRFGNVLGSRGSVIPIFKDQIKAGGPVTVTHPEMHRYFMAISEAVLLVLQSAAIGLGGEVYVLDMGAPVRVLELANDMIRMAGKEPGVDIPIVFTGIRPGEKLFEDIMSAEEGTEATKRDRIFMAKLKPNLHGRSIFIPEIDRIESMLGQLDHDAAIDFLQRMVPTYKPANIAVPLSAD